MSIQKLNLNATAKSLIEDLNDMVLEVEGIAKQGQFDVNEIDALYTDLGIDRKFLRNQSLGNDLGTYTNWSHVKAEAGYSIWKITPSSYGYDTNNRMYFDNKLLSNKLLADSESATSFDKVWMYEGDSGIGYTDHTTEASSEAGTEFSLMDSQNDYLYVGLSTTFAGIKFEFQTRGSGYNLTVEYYNASSGDGWVAMTANINDLDDDTSNFESDGRITWSVPSDWATTTVSDSTSRYYVRISSTTASITTAKAYYIIPGNSVIGLLALSTDEITNEKWAWCSYSGDVYVTIRNSGNSAYEGDAYITSSSNAANLQNFFIYNHIFSIDYKDSTYVSPVGSGLSANSGETIADGNVVYISAENEIGLANATDNTKPAVAVVNVDANSNYKLQNNGIVQVKTVGNGNIGAGDLLWLSGNTAGTVDRIPPQNSGNIIQIIGRAISNESSSTVKAILNIDYNPNEL